MINQTITFLKDLTAIHSPSGDTELAIHYVKEQLIQMGYAPELTRKGGLYVEVEGRNKTQKRCITAHVDTLGAMVKEVLDDGRVRIDLIGGFKYNAIEGEYCSIRTADDQTFTGTILLHETSPHVYLNNQKIERTQDHMEVRIDAKVISKEETLNLGINVGDFVSFNPRTEVTATGFIKSRHLDDKVSVALMLSYLKELSNNKITLPYTTIFYISNNEEIGYGANSNIDTSVEEFIALDMGAIGDGQNTDEYSVSICAKDASGPYHKKLRHHLVNLCRKENIPYKVDIYPYYASDATGALHAGADVKHGLFGAGIESSHAMERTHEDGITATYNLLKAYCESETMV
ncbi:M42 family metallopeptidase [Staphylococcus hyicus]|uniref:M42 family metallopeptidase n=1 Tax=Staphylococcus hyicus TaxID=1284 RepID=UPI00211CC9B0|nr:M42 family metallopeptidase [Staphylococcus hyicus]MCQ9299985.1 M42 family metallopeptidase [Staphylococcus hyicus]